MSDRKEKLTESYKRKKAVTLTDFLCDERWTIEEAEYDEKIGKYVFKAKHEDGRVETLSRNRQYVENLLDKLENDKRRTD